MYLSVSLIIGLGFTPTLSVLLGLKGGGVLGGLFGSFRDDL